MCAVQVYFSGDHTTCLFDLAQVRNLPSDLPNNLPSDLPSDLPHPPPSLTLDARLVDLVQVLTWRLPPADADPSPSAAAKPSGSAKQAGGTARPHARVGPAGRARHGGMRTGGAADCGECVHCRDKKRFGGPGIMKKGCLVKAAAMAAAEAQAEADDGRARGGAGAGGADGAVCSVRVRLSGARPLHVRAPHGAPPVATAATKPMAKAATRPATKPVTKPVTKLAMSECPLLDQILTMLPLRASPPPE